MPDLEAACPLTSKQLEEFMDDDCQGPVSSGDPMLSSPHLSPLGVLPSPASSGSHYSANDDVALTPDSMDLAVWQSAGGDQINGETTINNNNHSATATSICAVSSSNSNSPIYVTSAASSPAALLPLLPSTPVPPSAASAVTSSAVTTTTLVGGPTTHLFMLQPCGGGAGGVGLHHNGGSTSAAGPRLTTLDPRGGHHHRGDDIESALSNTEKIVANLLQKQVVLKERTPNCFVVLWLIWPSHEYYDNIQQQQKTILNTTNYQLINTYLNYYTTKEVHNIKKFLDITAQVVPLSSSSKKKISCVKLFTSLKTPVSFSLTSLSTSISLLYSSLSLNSLLVLSSLWLHN